MQDEDVPGRHTIILLEHGAVVFLAFSQAFFKGAILMFQRDAEMKNIVLADATARAATKPSGISSDGRFVWRGKPCLHKSHGDKNQW